MPKLINTYTPCDKCGLTAEDNERAHCNCDFCDFVGCEECTEEHVIMQHEDELYDDSYKVDIENDTTFGDDNDEDY